MSERCKKCGQATGYQGWRNYATWAFALWLDNEEPTYRMAHEWAREAHREASDHPNVPKVWPADRAAVFILADRLKEWAEEQAPDHSGTVWGDLLMSALADVEWVEVAEHYLADLPAEG